MNTNALATEAVRAAASLRSQFRLGPSEGICPYDLAMEMEIKVSFVSAPSLEGMYSPDPSPPSIILSSERPAGRKRFSCGHELGHHVFKHGFKMDELDESNSSSSSPEEFIAQRFASALLMPKLAVDASFGQRGWNPRTADATQFFIVSQELGVGFTTLISNAEINFKYLNKAKADKLRATSLKALRKSIASMDVENDVFPLDEKWNRRTVDVESGDLIVIPTGVTILGNCVIKNSESTFVATSQGQGVIQIGSRSINLRVSRRNFTGLARYRYLEDEDDE